MCAWVNSPTLEDSAWCSVPFTRRTTSFWVANVDFQGRRKRTLHKVHRVTARTLEEKCPARVQLESDAPPRSETDTLEE